MYRLSELYGRIGQVLRENGDMEIVRMQAKGIDAISNQIADTFIPYSNEDMQVFVDENYGSKFVISIPVR